MGYRSVAACTVRVHVREARWEFPRLVCGCNEGLDDSRSFQSRHDGELRNSYLGKRHLAPSSVVEDIGPSPSL